MSERIPASRNVIPAEADVLERTDGNATTSSSAPVKVSTRRWWGDSGASLPSEAVKGRWKGKEG